MILTATLFELLWVILYWMEMIQDSMGKEEDGQDFFQSEIGTKQCILSSSLNRISPTIQDYVILPNHTQCWVNNRMGQNYQRRQNYNYRYNRVKYVQKKEEYKEIKEELGEISMWKQKKEEKMEEIPTKVVEQNLEQWNIREQIKGQSSHETVPTQNPSMNCPNEQTHPQNFHQSSLIDEDEQLNTAYIQDIQQPQTFPSAQQTSLIPLLLSQQVQLQPQQLRMDLNPGSKIRRCKQKKLFLQICPQEYLQTTKILSQIQVNSSISKSINQSQSDHSINLNHIIYKHISQKYCNIHTLLLTPKRKVHVDIHTNGFIRSLSIKRIRVIPINRVFTAEQCDNSQLISLHQTQYDLPNNQYRQSIKTITLCTINIPQPPSSISSEEYFELVGSHMLQIEASYIICVCSAKSIVGMKDGFGSESCRRCSNNLKVSIKAMRVTV